jgi:YggT family protein
MNALIYLIETFSRLYLLCFLLRIIFQLARVDFYHPFAQFIVQVTNPLVVPARRILPGTRHIDLPTLTVLIALQFAFVVIVSTLRGADPSPGAWLLVTIYWLMNMTIWTLIICILIYVILSWVQPGYSPAAVFLRQIVDPILRPARRILPPISGVDLSPMIVMILLWALLLLVRDVMTLFAS